MVKEESIENAVQSGESQYEQYKKLKRQDDAANIGRKQHDYNITAPFERIRIYGNQKKEE